MYNIWTNIFQHYVLCDILLSESYSIEQEAEVKNQSADFQLLFFCLGKDKGGWN